MFMQKKRAQNPSFQSQKFVSESRNWEMNNFSYT